jgi:hypothetical protein
MPALAPAQRCVARPLQQVLPELRGRGGGPFVLAAAAAAAARRLP